MKSLKMALDQLLDVVIPLVIERNSFSLWRPRRAVCGSFDRGRIRINTLETGRFSVTTGAFSAGRSICGVEFRRAFHRRRVADNWRGQRDYV